MNKHLKNILILIFLAYLFFIFGNSLISLTNPDEVFYTLTAKEMVNHNTWMTPYLFEQPQFEKPILTYWLIRIGFLIFGFTNFAARFFPALFGLLGILALYALSLVLFKSEKKAFISYLCKKDNSSLVSIAQKNNLTGYAFDDKYNPCGQPRLGTGYLVFGLIGMLLKFGFIKNYNFSVLEAIVSNIKKISNYDLKEQFDNNPAKQMAVKLVNKFVILVGSEFLEGAIHGFANQLNETAKTNSSYHIIPEMNHHRMEGLANPKTFKNNSIFIFYPSKLFLKRNYVRYSITKKIIEKNGYEAIEHNLIGNDKITQTLETIIFNSYVSYYLAMLYQIDPCKIPWVDYFKDQLKKIK